VLMIHLSDIHFRHEEVGSAMDPNAHLRNELLLDAVTMCDKIGTSPDSIVISGDIAFSGHPAEYDFAYEWLESLCKQCGADLSSVFVVPGNHDVVRTVASQRVIQALHRDIKSQGSIALDGTLRGLLNDDETGDYLYKSLGNYNDFAGQFFCDLLPPDRMQATRELELNDGSVLRLVGLNSTFVSSSADAPGDLFVDPAAFQIMREPGVEKVILCHHPYDWLRQGDILRDHLNDVARLHLFGHNHTNRIEPARDWFRISASAAHPDRNELGWEPGYNLIELNVVGEDSVRELSVDVHVRVWQQRPDCFRAKMDKYSEVFSQSIKLGRWNRPQDESEQSDEPGVDSACEKEATEVLSEVSDPMDTLRAISIRFFRLNLSQKLGIAGKLELLEEDDTSEPDFERFRRVLIRARERGLIDALDKEIELVAVNKTLAEEQAS